MQEPKAYIINKKDYFQLYSEQNQGHTCKKSWISQALDSREDGTVWHRCRINCEIPVESHLYIAWFASDHLPTAETEIEVAKLWQQVVVNSTDFLIHSAQGRYLWIKIETVNYTEQRVEIIDLRIDFPRQALTLKLPDIYQQDARSSDFLNRFLSLFQSLMEEMDEQLANRDRYLSVDYAEREFLYWLCKWLDIRQPQTWQEDRLRIFMREVWSLYRIKGTRQSINRIVEIFTGAKPYIVEQYQATKHEQSTGKDKLWKKLYGDNVWTFTVLVPEQYLESTQQYIELKRIVESFTPAHTILNLVVMRDYLFLDSYTYLGVNSLLAGSGNLVLDGKASIPFESTIEEWRIS